MRSGRSRRVGLLGRMLVWIVVLLLLGGAWCAGLIWFVAEIPNTSPPIGAPADTERTDAIVVLTGGSQRLTTGLSLLAHGYSARLFVSGVYDGVEVRELLSVWSRFPESLADSVILGYSADNTIGNAVETAAWMREQGFHSLRLVTANYHMARSLLEFQMAMPEARVIAHPVVPSNVRIDDWWRWRRSAVLLAGEFAKYLVVRLRYWIDTTLAPSIDDGRG